MYHNDQIELAKQMKNIRTEIGCVTHFQINNSFFGCRQIYTAKTTTNIEEVTCSNCINLIRKTAKTAVFRKHPTTQKLLVKFNGE